MRRVVITGIGLVTPLANGRETSWRRLTSGESGLKAIEHFRVDDLGCRIAGLVPWKSGRSGTEFSAGDAFDPDQVMSAKERRRVDDFILYAVAAADEALADADWKPESEEDRIRTGVLVGAGIGGLSPIADTAIELEKNGPRRISPFFIPSALINLASGQISIRHGLKGPNHAVVTACATGAHALGDSMRMIQWGDADVMVAGGTESPICRIGIAGFLACRAMSTGFNDTPTKASRPYDKDRDGFVMGEGAGVFVLEEYEHAKRRGAKIYAEIVGYGLSGDAYHITSPDETGNGGERAMRMALERSGLDASEIDYVNAHGTSTPAGDEIEVRAVERVLGNAVANVHLSSTKSSIGHLLGAAGAVEAAFCALAIRDGVIPPTLNLENPSFETPINLTPNTAVEKKVRAALSNSFGFGGTNAALVMKAVD
ncbi:MAG: beta-ketoacyl-ACP synthase II [Hyphomonadaceae bacterium]